MSHTDKYVCGLHDGALCRRLLIEKDFTLKKAIEILQCLHIAKTENALLGIKNFKSEKHSICNPITLSPMTMLSV